MTLFELVKLVLDGLYNKGFQKYGNELDAKIIAQMTYLAESYGNLNSEEREPINYRDPATRFAYVYKYVAAHGDYLVQILEELKTKTGGNIFNGDTVRLSCIGGGPGSDVIGTLKYLAENPEEPVRKMTCYLLDRELAWGDTWTEIGDLLVPNIIFNAHVQPLDVINPESWEAATNFLKAQLFILSYFVSEVLSPDNKTMKDFWQKIFDEAVSGAMFIYLDNGHESFDNYFDDQWKDRGELKAILQKNNERMVPRLSEQKRELDDYFRKFGYFPKLESYVSYRVLRKR